MNFADKLIEQIKKKNTPICVGLDPRLELIPDFIKDRCVKEFGKTPEAAARAILEFNTSIIDAVADLVPVIKPQSAYFEMYGYHGWRTLEETIQYAHRKGLLVILDAKRNDIGSTAEAYSAASIGTVDLFGDGRPSLNADAVTVTPYLGSDGVKPFMEDCKKYSKGIFILVKTSNASSADIQDLPVQIPNSRFQIPMYEHLAHLVAEWSSMLIGSSGYSPVGVVIGATFPREAAALRKIMPQSIFLVPGYGAQGGTTQDVLHCFNSDGLGALINSSRNIIYAYQMHQKPPESFTEEARVAVKLMANSLKKTLKA